MAAASAGTIQTSGAPIVGAALSHVTLQQQQHQSQQQQHHQQQQQQSQQRLPYVQQADSGSHQNVVSSCGSGAGTVVSSVPLPQHQQRSANVAPGWKRHVTNGEIVYFSPSGATLRTIGQIKDYLLSPGTCKCGLPCPLRPDYFFEFNSQVPNLPLQIPLDSRTTRSTSCLHQARLLDSSNSILHRDSSKKRKASVEWSSSPSSISTSPSPQHQCSYSGTSDGNVTPHQQMVSAQRQPAQSVPSRPIVQGSFTPPSQQQQQQQQQSGAVYVNQGTNENKIANVTVSRTPPWRKNSILNQQTQQHQQQSQQQQQQQQQQQIQSQNSGQHTASAISDNNARVPPLPQQHLLQSQQHQQPNQNQQAPIQQSQSQPPPWQEETQKRRINSKKRPNFKEDPTGYLDHQTAILHSSILNVHSPDIPNHLGTSPNNQQSSYQPSAQQIKQVQPGDQQQLINNQNMQINVPSHSNPENSQHVVSSDHQLSRQQISVMQHQNQNVYQQQQQMHENQIDTGSKQQNIVVDSNGQPVRIIQNAQVMYANSNYPVQSMKVHESQCNPHILTTADGHVLNSNSQILSSGQQPVSHGPTASQRGPPHTQQVFQQQPRMLAPQQVISNNMQNRQIVNQIPTSSAQHQNVVSRNQLITVQQQHPPTSQSFVVSQSPKPLNQQLGGDEQQMISSNMVQSSQSNRILIASQDADVSQQQQHDTATMGLSIGGQTVTHLPNGMVQVHQNCDMTQLKQQQQIQLQQQIQQQNILYRQQQELQNFKVKDIYQSSSSSPHEKQRSSGTPNQSVRTVVAASQESPVSSSTAYSKQSGHLDRQSSKGPAQVGAISTSNDSPSAPEISPASSPEPPHSRTPTSTSQFFPPKMQTGGYAAGQTTGKNTITSVLAGKAMTSTTSISKNTYSRHNQQPDPDDGSSSLGILEKQVTRTQMIHINANSSGSGLSQASHVNSSARSIQVQNCAPVTSNISGLQLQPICREQGNQFIMTSSGQIIVMPTQGTKSSNQMIISSGPGNTLMMNNSPQNVVINQQGSQIISGDMVHGINHQVVDNQRIAQQQQANIIQNSGNSVVIQGSNMIPGQNIIQSSNNIIATNNGNGVMTTNSSNFIVSSPNNMQPVILNNGNVIQQGTQNVLHGNGANIIGSGTKVISNTGGIISGSNIISNQPNVITTNNQIISANNSGNIISPNNTVVLPNGYVLQPQSFTTVDGQMVNVINQDNGATQFVQQTQQRIILSPDSKRRAKKRKSSSGTPPTPHSLSPQQSPNVQQHSPTIVAPTASGTTMLQLTPQYQQQSFQISSGVPGITLVQNKSTQNSAPHQQQILLQNGQTIIQPLNLIGQQLIVPAGLMVAPDATLLQIQNVAPCGSIITPQGMMIRAQNPQSKGFLSPNSGSQQFIVSGNGQISPIGQVYSTPMGLVVPQSNSGSTFVQQNTTIVQQQTTMMSNGTNNGNAGGGNSSQQSDIAHSVSTQTAQAQQQQHHQQQNILRTISPPDTTTHSPRSPERPESQRSGGSDTNMVQCVSSSEPDSVVSPMADSAQSPSHSDYDRTSSTSISYQHGTFKPSDAKIRRIQTPTQFSHHIAQGNQFNMKPDSHESSPTPPTPTTLSSTTTLSTVNSTFCIGELVWGAARGHPAWPGKIVSPPEGVAPSSTDSTWVQWFGGRPNIELVAIGSLKSLSEGLEAHHKAQKDTRKSRKLNSQLERAIQEAMAELDRATTAVASTTPNTTANTNIVAGAIISNSNLASTTTTASRSHNKVRQPKPTTTQHQQQSRTKPVRIAPAPPSAVGQNYSTKCLRNNSK